MTSAAGPSNAFNFNGQGPPVGGQRRSAMQPQGLVGVDAFSSPPTMTSTLGPSNAAIFNDQGPGVGGQLRPAMQSQGHVGMVNPDVLVDPGEPACQRLISNTFSSHEVISLVEAVFANKDEVKMVREFRGDAAQAFVDVVHGVRFHFLRSFGAV